MKKIYLLLALLLTSGYAMAERVSQQRAVNVAASYLEAQGKIELRKGVNAGLSLAYVAKPDISLRSHTGVEVYYYVFNLPDNDGFIIVSGDDCAIPVLGTAQEGKFDLENASPGFLSWLKEYEEQIAYAVKTGIPTDTRWKELESESETNQVSTGNLPFLGMARWHQYDPYGQLCPNRVAGCGPVGMSIVMKYFYDRGYPVRGNGSRSYTSNGINLSATFSAYDFKNMPLKTDDYKEQSQKDAVAKLLYHCGVSTETEYKNSSASTYLKAISAALTACFGFSNDLEMIGRNYFQNDVWYQLIKKELDNRFPVLYQGKSERNSVHLFILEGYNSNNEFYVNWGWGGHSNGYYALSALSPSANYQYSHWMLFNIRHAGNDRIVAAPLKVTANYSGTGMSANINEIEMYQPFNVSVGAVENVSLDAFLGSAGIALFDAAGNIKQIVGKRTLNLPLRNYYSSLPFACMITLPVESTDILRTVYSSDNEQTWLPLPCGTGVTDHLPVSGKNTGNDGIADSRTKVWIDGNILHIQSAASENITVYTLAGKMIFKSRKPEGATCFLLNGCTPGEFLIIKGESGWERKSVIKRR